MSFLSQEVYMLYILLFNTSEVTTMTVLIVAIIQINRRSATGIVIGIENAYVSKLLISS